MKTTLIAATLLLGFAVAGTSQSAQAAPLNVGSFANAHVDANANANDLLHVVRGGNRDNRASDGFRVGNFGHNKFGKQRHSNRNFNRHQSRRNNGFAQRGFGHSRLRNHGFVNRGFGHRSFGHHRRGHGFAKRGGFGFFFGRH